MKKLVTAISIIIWAISAQAQDVHFSQFTYNPLSLSPAMAGANYNMQAVVNYKNQWGSVTTPFKTMSASADFRLPSNSRDGFFVTGINFNRDVAGDSRMGRTFANVLLGYQLIISKESMLGLAVNGGFIQRSLQTTDLQWGSQYDGTGYNSNMNPGESVSPFASVAGDLGAGLVYSYKSSSRYVTVDDPFSANVGIGFDHLLKPANDFSINADPLYRKFTAFACAKINSRSSKVGMEPSAMFVRQGPSQEIMFGTFFNYNIHGASKVTTFVEDSRIALGVFYRNKDAVVLGLRFDISNFSAGVSYDVNLSDLSTASNGRGGLEIMLRFVSPNPFNSMRSTTMFR